MILALLVLIGLSAWYLVVIILLNAELKKMREAIGAVYYAGVWSCDRSVDERLLWTRVRDACGFPKGQSPAPKELDKL
jgi:hypothetical protein